MRGISALLMLALVGCGEGLPTGPDAAQTPRQDAQATIQAPEASPASPEAPGGLSAEWPGDGSVVVASGMESPAWIQVVWEHEGGAREVKSATVPALGEVRLSPECLYPGTTLVSVPGHGLWHRYVSTHAYAWCAQAGLPTVPPPIPVVVEWKGDGYTAVVNPGPSYVFVRVRWQAWSGNGFETYATEERLIMAGAAEQFAPPCRTHGMNQTTVSVLGVEHWPTFSSWRWDGPTDCLS